MAVPKRRSSKSRARLGRAAQAARTLTLRDCPRCGSSGRPHTVCDNCGTYRGRQIVDKDEF